MTRGQDIPVIIGTRGSELALWQANFTKSTLEQQGIKAELKIIKTKGDATQQWNLSFDKIEGKGFFTKELEDALLAGEIDLAVHSCKDLPTESPEGLTIAAYSQRANPFDLLVIRKAVHDPARWLGLPSGARVGTSSGRRKAQLAAIRPDVQLSDLRGNVPTRVQRLRDGQYDAIILAAAGLERLKIDLSEFHTELLKAPMFIPAPAQGILAFQIREGDELMHAYCRHLAQPEDTALATMERHLLHVFHGGCQIPLGVYAQAGAAQSRHIWVSYAPSAADVPIRMHINVQAAEWNTALQEKLVRHLREHQPQPVYISSDYQEGDYIIRVLKAQGYSVEASSLIEFSAVDFQLPPETNWLFFSSKNGVEYFFKGCTELPATIRIAAINKGTAQAILAKGYSVDFVGDGDSIDAIVESFDQTASGVVAFPQPTASLQSVQQRTRHQALSLVVYENRPKTNTPERQENVLVFTSPLSASAYFSQHTLQSYQQVVSIGNTTSARLKELGVEKVITAYEPTQWALVDAIVQATFCV